MNFDPIPISERSRFVCYPCSKEVHGLVVCDGPVCRRCTRFASIQELLDPRNPSAPERSEAAKRIGNMLNAHIAAGLLRKPPKIVTSKGAPAS